RGALVMRVFRAAFLAFFSLFSSHSFAGFYSGGQASSGLCFSDAASACETLRATSFPQYPTSSVSGSTCQMKNSGGAILNTVGIGTCDASCPAGQERFNGMCVPVCQPGFTRDEAGVCQPPDEPCDANDQAAAQSAVAAQNALPATVSNGNLTSGYNQVNESVTTFGSCES